MDNNIEKTNGKKGLIIGIVILLICLLTFGIYKYITMLKTPKNIYMSMISNLENKTGKMLNEMDKNLKTSVGTNYNIKLQINDGNAEVKKIKDILNKMNFNFNTETNIKKKVVSSSFDFIYDDNSILKGSMLLDKNDMFLEIPELYAKSIKLKMDGSSDIWASFNNNNMRIIIEEYFKVFKKSLRSEYFSSTTETISINNESVSAQKEILDLEGKNYIQFQKDLYDNILKNNKLLKALSKTSYVSVNELKEVIKYSKDNIAEDSKGIKVSTYIKDNKILRVSMASEDAEFIFDNNGDNVYDINIKANEESIKIGTIEVNENIMKLNIDFNGIKVLFDIESNNNQVSKALIKAEFEGNRFDLDIKEDNNNVNGNLKLLIKNEIDANLYITGNVKENININKNISKNSVDFDKLTQSDYNSIMNNLYNNEALLTLFQDISSAFGEMTDFEIEA